jgi:hypothetical protein
MATVAASKERGIERTFGEVGVQAGAVRGDAFGDGPKDTDICSRKRQIDAHGGVLDQKPRRRCEGGRRVGERDEQDDRGGEGRGAPGV